MLFSSSLVTYGRGKGIVVETGMTTEVGKIAEMINQTEEQITPLQQKLNKLGKTLGIAALAICVFIFIIGLLQHKESNSYVYDSSIISCCSNSRRISCSFNNCSSNWCSKNGKRKMP